MGRQDFYHSVRNHATYDLSISISDTDSQLPKLVNLTCPKKTIFLSRLGRILSLND